MYKLWVKVARLWTEEDRAWWLDDRAMPMGTTFCAAATAGPVKLAVKAAVAASDEKALIAFLCRLFLQLGHASDSNSKTARGDAKIWV